MKQNFLKHIAYFAACLFILTACNVTRRLPEGEQLYTGADINIKKQDAYELNKKKRKELKEKLEAVVRPKPNSSILGIKFKLWVYQVAGEPKKEKGIRNWLRNKVGEPPVLASEVNLQSNVKLLNNRMENLGYFQAFATGDTVSKHKKVHAEYTVTPGVQYTIRKIIIPDDTTLLVEKNIKRTKRRTLLKEGDPYDLDVFMAERVRIDERLKQRGYYYFNPDYILMRVDSTVGNNQVDVFVTLKPEAPRKAVVRYFINDIFIYPDYDLSLDTLNVETNAVRYKDFYIIDPKKNFKPQVFDRVIYFNKGDVYNRRNHNLTLNRMVSLGTFKFVKNNFKENLKVDSPKLDVYYYLTPLKRKSLRTELTAKTNTAGYAGTELDVSWRNRNTFRGAELLTIKAYGGLDFQINGQNKGYNVYSLGGEMSLTWPKIVPINFKSNGAFIPHTRLTLGYDWQTRQKLYTLNTARASFGYFWKGSEKEEHEFNITNLTYVNSTNVTQEYRDKIKLDSTLERVIEKQFILGPTYSYTFTNTMRSWKKHTIYYNGKLDLSCNLLGLIQGANAREDNYKTLFDVRYSQYIKTEQDIRYYLKLGKNNQWANRVYFGLGVPYGNSLQLPFIKQFYSGGSNSLRGFRTRTVGPGTFRPVVGPDDFLPDQTGDIKLEMNTELRFKMVSFLYGALFVDAGNIWLKNASKFKPGGQFSNQFLKELAVDAGIGFRFDFSILILRTDFAIPLRKPWLPNGEQWVIDKIAFGDKAWRKENLVFNLAVGLPF